MSYTNGLDKPSDYFNTVLYSGSASSLSVTGVGFQPDWIWIKRRNATANHKLTDSIMGAGLALSITTSAEVSQTGIASFDSDGFTLGTGSADHNTSGGTYASWNWLASNTTASNTDGSITSTVSANTTAGFSIVSYTGTGANATVGHGLSSAPEMVICKNRDSSVGWSSWHTGIGDGTKYFLLNTTQATLTATNIWNSTTPTSSVVSLGSHLSTNESTSDMIMYCFHSVKGYSKFGSYTGNGNADGTFVYTGFKPAWFMQKRIDVANGWHIFDTKRDTFNACERYMTANVNSSEPSGTDYVDILSNGLKMRRNGNDINGSGATYIYMAFAENPFVTSTGIPTPAR